MTKWRWHRIGTDNIANPALFEPCPICGALAYGRETGAHGRIHKGCFTAVNRWVRPKVADDEYEQRGAR
jgi:hypothetical protein